jgi:dolichol-phosphate mannosyltransferase
MEQSLSIVVPVFNEREVIRDTFKSLVSLAKVAPLDQFLAIELIFVNDGSNDGTASELECLRKSPLPPAVTCTVIHFTRNFGHSAAVIAGLHAATCTLVAVIDADLQDPPELIPRMCEEIGAGYDVVYGQRIGRTGESAFKKLTAWAFYRLLASLTGVRIPKDTGDFRVMTREVREAVLACQEQDPFLRGLVAWVGFSQKAFRTRDSRGSSAGRSIRCRGWCDSRQRRS